MLYKNLIMQQLLINYSKLINLILVKMATKTWKFGKHCYSQLSDIYNMIISQNAK